MVNVVTKRCEYTECRRVACFGPSNTKGTTHCRAHKLDGMVLKVGMVCAAEGCISRVAVYGYINIPIKSQKLVCCDHNVSGMMNVRANRCTFVGCEAMYPMYGYIGTDKGLRCSKHRMKEMARLKAPQRDCYKENCGKLSTFGFPGKGDTSCSVHIEEGMVYLSTKRCQDPKGCVELATHGNSAKSRNRCSIHKQHGDINILENKCGECGFMDVIDKDGMCKTCGAFQKRQRSKQLLISKFLESNGYKYHYDKVVDSPDVIKVIPDFRLIDIDTHEVVLEVDEFQHFGRECTCEQLRMMRVWQELGKPLFLIRYNPDIYKKKGEHHRKENEGRSERHSILKKWIKYAAKHNPADKGACFEVIYLFFDGYSKNVRPIIVQKMES